MKKIYRNLIGISLIVGSTLLLYSFSSDTELNNDPKKNSVPISKAKEQIEEYQKWGLLLPKTFKIETSENHVRIIYDESIFKMDEWNKKFNVDLEKFKRNSNILDVKNHRFPMYPKPTFSYYISKEDIKLALEEDPNATGLNVYLAARGTDSMSLSKLESHLLIVPTRRIDDSTLIDLKRTEKSGDSIAFDLTHPCPAMCDKSSPLYNPLKVSIDSN